MSNDFSFQLADLAANHVNHKNVYERMTLIMTMRDDHDQGLSHRSLSFVDVGLTASPHHYA